MNSETPIPRSVSAKSELMMTPYSIAVILVRVLDNGDRAKMDRPSDQLEMR